MAVSSTIRYSSLILIFYNLFFGRHPRSPLFFSLELYYTFQNFLSDGACRASRRLGSSAVSAGFSWSVHCLQALALRCRMLEGQCKGCVGELASCGRDIQLLRGSAATNYSLLHPLVALVAIARRSTELLVCLSSCCRPCLTLRSIRAIHQLGDLVDLLIMAPFVSPCALIMPLTSNRLYSLFASPRHHGVMTLLGIFTITAEQLVSA